VGRIEKIPGCRAVNIRKAYVDENVFFVLAISCLAGCAAGSKNHAAQSQQAEDANYRRDHRQESYYSDHDDRWQADAYEKTSNTAYSAPAAILSPRQIQRALKSAGFYKGDVDGKIGPKTKAAVIRFQRSKGLKADGIVGRRTSAELKKYLSR